MSEPSVTKPPIPIFYSYARADERLRQHLEKHLSLLRQQGIISEWHHRQILPGAEWAQDINAHLNIASIILLLISPDYLASDYCYSTEMQYALERHETKSARVIPIILRPVDWSIAPFAHIQCLPRNEKPVTLWRNRDLAFYEIVQGIRAALADLLASIAPPQQEAITTSTQPGMKPDSTHHEKEKNRHQFLRKVHTIWIAGMLERSLEHTGMIKTTLYEQPGAVENPWKPLMQEIEGSARPISPDTSIAQVYDDSQHALLILGEPGAGKTTLLLELTRSLLERTERDEKYPMPVIFNLSSWAEKRAPLSRWLTEELEIRYQIPHQVAIEWVESKSMILLLDGLDEVVLEHRGACINAINAYRREHSFVPMVVCSRTEEYRTQKSYLTLDKAISVEPLTFQQIDAYLERAGEQAKAIHLSLRNDTKLRELVTTPLMLNVLIQTYQETSLDDLLATSSEKRQQQLFNAYVGRMLSRGKIERQYPKEQTKHWLTWLARQMQLHDQTIFYIEQMQPDWLSERHLYQIYNYLAVRLPDMLIGSIISIIIAYQFFSNFMDIPYNFYYGFLGALTGGLLSCKRHEQSPGEFYSDNLWKYFRDNLFKRSYLINGLVIGMSSGLFMGIHSKDISVGLCYGLGFGGTSYLLSFLILRKNWTGSHTSIFPRSWENFWNNFLGYKSVNAGLIVGLCMACGYVISTELVYRFQYIPSDTIGYAIGYLLNYTQVGILVDILLERRKPGIQPAEIVDWSWKNLWYSFNNMRHLRNALLVGFLSGLLTALSVRLIPHTLDSAYGLKYGVIIGLCYWLFYGLSRGLSSNTLDATRRMTPNQGIWYSARNSLLIGFFSFIISWSLYFLSMIVSYLFIFRTSLSWLIWSVIWPSVWLLMTTKYPLLIAVGIGILGAIISGGHACLQHVVLRWLLWRSKHIPWNYPQFLRHADRHILLRKIGGGYVFIHRLLLDYFASYEVNNQMGED
jgi:DNA polymerase III delta prime subunit